MANFVCCLNLLLVVLALCTLQGDATFSNRVKVSFKQSEYRVKESAGRVAITIQAVRRYHTSFYVKVRASVNRNLRHHASSYDFEESLQTVRFLSRQTTATVYIKIKDDNRVESTEAFAVEIFIPHDLYSNGIWYGSPDKAKVLIMDDDKVVVTRPPTTRSPHTRPPATRPPHTRPPATRPPATRPWPPATRPPATKPPATRPPHTRPPATRPPHTRPPATRPPHTRPPATRPPVNNIYAQFSQEQYMVDETAEYALLKVTVSGHRTFAISVNAKIFVSSNFQPRAASSYDVRTGEKRLIFNPGVNALILKVRIYDDKRVEGTEAFGVQLIVPDHHARNGLKLGRPSVATVFIKDDERLATHPPTTRPPTKGTTRPTTEPPTRPTTHPSIKPPTTSPTTRPSVKVAFESGRYTVRESCTMLSVKLVVKGEVTQPFTVNVMPIGFHLPSAIAGKDFDSKVLQVHFQPGQSDASVCIVIIDDDIREGYEKFRLLLSIPHSVRALGVWGKHPYYADILIRDDSDDGKGLPVQSSPTDAERATMCICKPYPTPPTTPSPEPPTTPSTEPPTTPSTEPPTTPSTEPPTTPSTEPPTTPSTEPPTTPSTEPPTTPSTEPPTTPSTEPPTTPSSEPPTTPTPPTGFNVMFSNSSYCGDEADGVIEVTVVATGVSSVPYTATITPSELVPVSARELFDYSNDTIVVTFNPGETNKTVLVPINPDCTREGSEFFNLALSLDSAAEALGITLGDPSVATAEIKDIDVIFVNFSQVTYSAEESDGMMLITLKADGYSLWPYFVEVIPAELLPIGGLGNAEGNGTDFASNTLIAIFNPGDSEAVVSLPITVDQIPEPTEKLSLTITIPDEFSSVNGRLLVKPGINDVAEGEITDSL